jgi:uncharacterized protein YbcI
VLDERLAPDGQLNKAIANAVVRCHRRFIGRGPSRARTIYRDNVIVVIMRDALTFGERSLAATGDQRAVSEMRQHYQQAMRGPLIEAVQHLTGCKVEALMSAANIEPDLAAELFVLDRPVADVVRRDPP